MIVLIIIVSYIAHIFLCRWILKKAYQLNREYSPVKELLFTVFIPGIGFGIAIMGLLVEYLESEKGETWFNGKNW